MEDLTAPVDIGSISHDLITGFGYIPGGELHAGILNHQQFHYVTPTSWSVMFWSLRSTGTLGAFLRSKGFTLHEHHGSGAGEGVRLGVKNKGRSFGFRKVPYIRNGN